VTKTLRQAISKMRLERARAAMSFVVVIGLGLGAVRSAQAQTFTVLHSFAGYPSDGAAPRGGLLRDPTGNLYGTTFGGGSDDCNGGAGCGTVFKLDTSGTETVLYSFTQYGDAGFAPYSGLVPDAAGNLYGTTTSGGNSGYGDGTVFRIDKKGHETTLFTFIGENGAFPLAGLVRDSAGNLYGTTQQGGTSRECQGNGCGVVFKLNKNGKETILHSFRGGFTDGAYPSAELVRDSAGNLYGTTQIGGASNYGTVFKVTKSGKETVLHSFDGEDGANPLARLLRYGGKLYGTTSGGGAYRVGTVFEVDADGKETVLYSFGAQQGDGDTPEGGVTRDAAGNLYGVTYYGAAGAWGTVYKLDATGKEFVLHNFTGGSDGGFPYKGVIMDRAGNLYGTASYGGASGRYGTLWKLTP